MTNTSNSSGEIRGVFLVEDHPLYRLGLRQLLESQPDLRVCGETGKSEGALEAIKKAQPHVIIVDLSLSGGASGEDLIRQLRAAGISTPILVLSMFEELHYAERVLKAGANGYLMKQESQKRCLRAIRKVLSGESYLSEAMTQWIIAGISGGRINLDHAVDELSSRELEVFKLIGQNKSTRQIAAALNITSRTVDVHRSNIKGKLGVQDGAELVQMAVGWHNVHATTEMPRGDASPRGSDRQS